MRLTLVLFIGNIVMTTWSKINIVQWFEIDSSKAAFSRMVLDTITGNIYVGAMKNLYQLSSNLTLIKNATTGPKYDSPNCQPHNRTASGDQSPEQMNVYNKALVIDYDNNILIACSRLYHGICERYNLSDIESINTDFCVPVIANYATGTTVAFIAPGPVNGVLNPNVLYFATSKTNAGQSAFPDDVPEIASRKLDTFQLVYIGNNTNSSKSIQATVRDTFPVYYIYGFSSEKFSYFVTVQKENPKTMSYISKLIRVCQADKNYNSYAEVQLKCMHNGTHYNLAQAAYVGKAGLTLAAKMDISKDEDVLYVVCSIGNPNTVIPGRHSSLCVYPLRTVRKIFTENIQYCFDGKEYTGPSHIISPAPCIETDVTIKDDFCGTYDYNTPINGKYPIQAEAAIQFNTNVSALAVTTEGQDTIAFVGTVKGHIIKVLIKSKHLANSSEEITVEEGSTIHADMILYGRHLYVLTDSRIYKVQVQECNMYTSCSSCVNDNCGWNLWNLTCGPPDKYTKGACFTDLLFFHIPKEREQLDIPINRTEPLSGDLKMLECVFNNETKNISTKAYIKTDKIIRCDTSLISEFPPIQTEKESILTNLSVLNSGKIILQKMIIFYNCSLFTSCFKCSYISRDYFCTWDIKNNTCTYSRDPRYTILGLNTNGFFVFRGPQTINFKDELIVPSETNRTMVVSGYHLEDFQTPLTCFFNLDDGKWVNASVTRVSTIESTIECEPVYFAYLGNGTTMNVSFEIFWEGNRYLLMFGSKKVIIYKCDKMAYSCGECLTLSSKYKCGWCDQHCTIQSQCFSTWLSTADTCPNPVINTIEPTSGLKNGGTYITITGINLGIRFKDISIGVYIENSTRVKCDPLKDLYFAPRQIVCVSGISNITGTGKLVVTINKKYNVTATHTFSYVDPVLKEIIPNRGPKSGGTLVTINGKDMNAGNNRTVLIGNQTCEIKSVNRTVLTCITSMASDMTEKKLDVQFDNQMVKNIITYNYITDPTIINIDPKEAICSGGIMIDVTGTQLDTIQEPKMVLSCGETKIEGECTVRNATLMHCFSPHVKSINSNCSPNSTMKEPCSYGFILDNVKDVLNLTVKDKDKFGTFSIVSDPLFHPLRSNVDNTDIYEKDTLLIINATCLSGVSARDVNVSIGKGLCSQIAVNKSQITCKPPKDEPKSQQGSASPEVIVKIGRNFSTRVGFLRYNQQAVPVPPSISIDLKPIIIGLTVGVLALVFIFFVVILVLKKREKKSQMQWQIQMNNLESKVNVECKEDNTVTSGASGPVIDKSTIAVLKDARLIINRDRLRVGDIIGKGHFGCVLTGYITLPGDKGDVLVAIKTLHKKNLRDIDVDAFLREIMIMKEFDHPNVLRLLGLCLGQNDMPLMVLPFMEHGDLLSYIRDDTNIPTVKDLIQFGVGIAEGMAYLSDHKFVHRDLAARNCMLDKELNVKVADFGLSREIYEREYYSSDNKNTKLPIRWMAPESMEKGTYSAKSDVWSYGIVLWELVTKGVTPYPEVDNWDIVRYLQKGRRLSQPQYCPDKLYVIMQKCWLVDPMDRPTFSVLAREITDMVSVAEQDMQQGMLRIDIHHAQFNQVDSAKYHYAYDDTYVEPSAKSKPIGGANSGNDYIEVFDDTSDVQIDPTDGAKSGNDYIEVLDDSNDVQIDPTDGANSGNDYIEVLDDSNDVQIDPTDGANSGNDYIEVLDDSNDVQIDPMDDDNGNNKNELYRYAYADSSLERPTKSESVDGATNNYMDEYDDKNDVQIYLPGGTNSNSSHDSCHDERVSFADYTTIKLPDNI